MHVLFEGDPARAGRSDRPHAQIQADKCIRNFIMAQVLRANNEFTPTGVYCPTSLGLVWFEQTLFKHDW